MKTNSTTSNTFLLTARHDLIENKKPILLGVGTIWGIYMLFGALLGYNGVGGGGASLAFYMLSAMAFSCITASLAFSNLKTKESRISTIMLPSTAFDKFIVRWIAVVPVLILVIVAGVMLGEAVRVWLHLLGGYPHQGAGFMSMYADLCIEFLKYPASGYYVWLGIVGFLFGQSLYFLGSVLWPKLSFVKTLVVLWVLQTLSGFLTILVNLSWPDTFVNFITEISEEAAVGGIAGMLTLLTLAVYATTYWRFRRSQVVYKLF